MNCCWFSSSWLRYPTFWSVNWMCNYMSFYSSWFVYLGFYVAFNTVQVISRWVVGRAEETSTYSSLGFCTVNWRPTASNYQLSHLQPWRGSNPGRRGGRRECYHSATVAPFYSSWSHGIFLAWLCTWLVGYRMFSVNSTNTPWMLLLRSWTTVSVDAVCWWSPQVDFLISTLNTLLDGTHFLFHGNN